MPRNRRTQTGDPALAPPRSTPGVRFGEGEDLQTLARQLPAPAQPQVAEASAPDATSPASAASLRDALAALPSPGLLTAPTARPSEPPTSGLPVGPGPGPEILPAAPTQSPTGRFLRDLARITGREHFNDLARRAGL